MSESTQYPHGQPPQQQPPQQPPQQPHEEDTGTLAGSMFTLGAFLFGMVAVLAGLSTLTGWKFALKGAGIPKGWGMVVLFLGIGGVTYFIGWLCDNLTVRRFFRKNPWMWLVLVLGLGGGGYGLVTMINIWDAGGFVMYAAIHGNASKVESWLKSGEATQKEKEKMLRKVVGRKKPSIKIVRMLLDNGVSASVKVPPYKGTSRGYRTFHWACTKGNLKLIKAFVEKGAPINAKTKDGRTCLSMALLYYYRKPSQMRPIVKYLLDKNATFGKELSRYQRRRLRRRYPELADRLLKAQPSGGPMIPVGKRDRPGLGKSKKGNNLLDKEPAGTLDSDDFEPRDTPRQRPKPRKRAGKGDDDGNWLE